jgi:hypothetical protein
MSFTYGADGSLIKNTQSFGGELSYEHFDINKQIASFENIAKDTLNHKEHFQTINEAQNKTIERFQKHLNKYEHFIKNREYAYNNKLNSDAENFSDYIRHQENMCGSKLNQQNNLLSKQQDVLKKQQGAIEYFDVLNKSQNHANMKVAEYYKNLNEIYPENFTME